MQKMNLALINRGHRIHLMSSKLCNFYEQYKTYNLCNDNEQLLESMKALAQSSQFLHAHNEPSCYVSMWKEQTDKPVILDVHDSYLARITPEHAEEVMKQGKMTMRILVEERNNMQLADALVFPSASFAKLVCDEFNLKQPTLILPSYVPKQFYSYSPAEWLGGICYEGKTAYPGESKQFDYCNYVPFAEKCKELGVDFHIYAGRDLHDKEYQKNYSSAIRHEPVRFEKLIHRIGSHDWGLVGNITPHPEWDIAIPNKLFEYMAAGVPVCVMHAAEAAEFVRSTGIGIVVDSVEELRDRWKEHRTCRERLFKVRSQYAMDNQIQSLEEFYAKVAC